VDVYDGCQKDYTGDDVNPANFLSIITGNATAMQGIGSGKVLQSDENDHVFIFFTDHGGTGIICFPTGQELHATDLNAALVTMHNTKMYGKLVFYLEACESGSMFDGVSFLLFYCELF
jgi:legumain